MAGNFGKFIDRAPIICAAGKSTGIPKETVATTLREYSLEDEINALKHDGEIWVEDRFVVPREPPPFQNPAYRRTNTQISPVLNPPVKTRYQELIDNLKDTAYESYWKKQDGKSRDHVPGLPAGMVPLEVTYGTPTPKGATMKELINPPKTPYQVLWDTQVGHEMYRKTHNDYNPSEKVNRRYNTPPYLPDTRFGKKTNLDPRGVWVRCACEWHKNEPIIHSSKIQANYIDRAKPQLGKPLTPHHNIECVPEGHSFGMVSQSAYFGVEELLKDPKCSPCLFKRDFYKWLASLNRFRVLMKKRSNKNFQYDDFFKMCLYWDKERTGLLAIDRFYDICSCQHLTYPKQDVESLLKVLRIMVDDKIYYQRFIELINVNKPSLEIMAFNDIPEESKYYVSTAQAASCDYLIINNAVMPTAGIPSIRFDLPRPCVPPEGCRADLDHLGYYTTSNALLNPSVYTNYGLTFRDFFQPRCPKTIRTLFEKIGYTFPGDTFEKLWKIAAEHDKTGLVCVDTFKLILNLQCPAPKLLVDEQECSNKI